MELHTTGIFGCIFLFVRVRGGKNRKAYFVFLWMSYLICCGILTCLNKPGWFYWLIYHRMKTTAFMCWVSHFSQLARSFTCESKRLCLRGCIVKENMLLKIGILVQRWSRATIWRRQWGALTAAAWHWLLYFTHGIISFACRSFTVFSPRASIPSSFQTFCSTVLRFLISEILQFTWLKTRLTPWKDLSNSLCGVQWGCIWLRHWPDAAEFTGARGQVVSQHATSSRRWISQSASVWMLNRRMTLGEESLIWKKKMKARAVVPLTFSENVWLNVVLL